MAMAVLPVLRSPMISSRWPRPIGIIESIALMPVCSGWLTGWRSAIPGALNSKRAPVRGLDHALAVEGAAQRIDDAADQLGPHRHREKLAGAPHLVALADPEVVAQDDGAHRALLQVEDLAEGAVLELDPLPRHGAGQAVDARDAVAHLEHPPDLRHVHLGAVLADLLGDDGRDLVDVESHAVSSFLIRSLLEPPAPCAA